MIDTAKEEQASAAINVHKDGDSLRKQSDPYQSHRPKTAFRVVAKIIHRNVRCCLSADTADPTSSRPNLRINKCGTNQTLTYGKARPPLPNFDGYN